MADDIDDLLDEVESSFANEKKKESKSTNEKHIRRRAEDEEVDKLIDDICGDTDPMEKCNKVRNLPKQTSVTRSIPSKCFPLSIGGTAVAKGIGNSVNKRACDTLRCTACDFKVVSFDDFMWDPSTDYLFLRNNAPEFERLKSNLKRKKGYRAYCCQCCHVDVNQLKDVKLLQVKWVCGNH